MKKVGLIMGSDSDLPVVQKAASVLKELGIPYEAHVYSAHRTPAEARAWSLAARDEGFGRSAREDDIFHFVAAQCLGALRTEDPADGVADVALAAAIGTDDAGNAAVEFDDHRLCEGFKTVYFNAFKKHIPPFF